MTKRREWLLLFGLLALAIAVRWNTLRGPLFMDEAPLLRNIEHFAAQRTILPNHFSYPPLFSWLAVAPTGFGIWAQAQSEGLTASEWGRLEIFFDGRNLAMGGRLFSLASTLALMVLAWLAAQAAPIAARCAALLVIATTPEAVRYGAWMLPDMATALACFGAAWFAWRYAEQPRPRDLLIAGALGGVAAAMKYNGALVCLSVGVAAVFGPREGRWPLLAKSAALCIAVFLVLAPTWVLLPREAWGGFLFERANVATPRLGDGPANHLTLLLGVAAKNTAWLAGLVAACIAARTRRSLIVLAAPVAASFLVVGTWAKQDMNYLLPTLGVAAFALALAMPTPRWGVAACLIALIPFLGEWRVAMPSNADRMAAAMRKRPMEEHLVRIGFHTPKASSLDKAGAVMVPANAMMHFQEQLERIPIFRTVSEQLEPAALPADATLAVVAGEWLARRGLSDLGDGWKLVREERSGSGPAMLLFARATPPRAVP